MMNYKFALKQMERDELSEEISIKYFAPYGL